MKKAKKDNSNYLCQHIIDRKKQAEVYEASRSQMAAQLASVRQVSMEASFALEGLATAKSRWEVEVATLRADMQTMESERSESNVFSFCISSSSETFLVSS